MSQIVVNVPGCEKVSSKGESNGTITLTATDCTPPEPANLMVPGLWISGVLALVLIVAAGLCTFRWVELKPRRMEAKRLSRQQEIDGQVKMANAQRKCPSCTSEFAPVLTK